MTETTKHEQDQQTFTPPPPGPAPEEGDLPHGLTIFLTADQRERAVRSLRKLHQRRGEALCIALGISASAEGETP